MKKLFNKRIPTILGIILILLSIPLTTFILKNQIVFRGNASNSQEPQDVKMTNITDASFTITYRTELSSTGSISYGNDKKLGESELEDVDKQRESFSPKKIHSISVKKLIPNTKYYLTIISGSDIFLNNGRPFEVTTGTDISSPSAKSDLASAKMQTIKGKIVLPNGDAPSEALVYLNAENSQLLSTTTAKDGKFSFSLEKLRTDDLASYFSVNDNTVFKIVATDGSLKSAATATLSQKDSIPTITLSNDYDFIQELSLIASGSGELSGFPSIAPPGKNLKPQILNPKENQSFDSQKPQFRGTSLPNEKVEIIIRSDEQITTQITADSKGNWTYEPPNNLSPGVHTITIKTRDSEGILTTVMRSFTVFAAETQAPVQTVLPTLIPIPTKMPTPPPAVGPSPTIVILIPTPTSTPIPSPTVAPTIPKDGLPPTGNSPVLLIIGGIVSAIFGIALFLLTRTVL